MFNEPVLVFSAPAETVMRTYQRALSRGIEFTIFTDELFQTFDDHANRAAVAAVTPDQLRIAGMAFRMERKVADKILKGLKLHA